MYIIWVELFSTFPILKYLSIEDFLSSDPAIWRSPVGAGRLKIMTPQYKQPDDILARGIDLYFREIHFIVKGRNTFNTLQIDVLHKLGPLTL